MALKCPFCSAIAHCRASVYEAPSVKKTQTVQEPTDKKGQTLNRYGSASRLSSRQQIPV
ncbi:hypothetical protein ACSVOC_10410 [Salmonella enterica]|uniref:hypothetical protein n=1 Tax=Salmonella enterica TaxID=28901 RepID=UPI003F30E668